MSETVAASSTANEQETAFVSVENLNSEQRSEWLKSGTLPKVEPKAESAPAQDSEDVDTDSESASAPEAERKQEHKPNRSNAESRIKELLGKSKASEDRIKQLEAELAAARQPKETQTKAESSPAKTDKPEPTKLERPTRPKMDDYDNSPGKTLEDYEAAMDKYYEDLADYKAQEAVSKDRAARALEKAQQDIKQKIADAKAKYSDFDTVAVPAYQKLMANYEQMNPLVQDAMNRSSILEHVLYVLGGDQAKLDSFVEKAKTDPLAAVEEFSVLQHLVREELSKGTTKSESAAAERDDKGRFTGSEKAPEKKFSSAPPPAKEVGAQATAPADEAQAALDRGDMAAYRRIMNQRDLKSRGQ